MNTQSRSGFPELFPNILHQDSRSLIALLFVLLSATALSSLPLYGQHPQLTFEHRAFGAATLQESDSLLVIEGLGNGTEDGADILLGEAQLNRTEEIGFRWSLSCPMSKIPIDGTLHFDLIGGESEVLVAGAISRVDSGMLEYRIMFKGADSAAMQFRTEDEYQVWHSTPLMFQRPVPMNDTVEVELTYRPHQFDTGVLPHPAGIMEVEWADSLSITLPDRSTLDSVNYAHISADLEDVDAQFATAIRLWTDSILELTIDAESCQWTSARWVPVVSIIAAGNARVRVNRHNALVITGMVDGRTDGVDLVSVNPWTGEPQWYGEEFRVELDCDFRNPDACLIATSLADDDTLQRTGFIRDDLGVRLEHRLPREPYDADFSEVTVAGVGQYISQPGRVLGWFQDNIRLTSIDFINRGDRPYQTRFELASPAVLFWEHNVFQGRSFLINPLSDPARPSFDDVTRFTLRAGDIDTLTLTDSYFYVSDVESRTERPSETQLTINPNPISDQGRIEWHSDASVRPSGYQVSDILGRRIESGDIGHGMQSMSWNAGNLPAGVYLLTLFDEEGGKLATERMIKR